MNAIARLLDPGWGNSPIANQLESAFRLLLRPSSVLMTARSGTGASYSVRMLLLINVVLLISIIIDNDNN